MVWNHFRRNEDFSKKIGKESRKDRDVRDSREDTASFWRMFTHPLGASSKQNNRGYAGVFKNHKYLEPITQDFIDKWQLKNPELGGLEYMKPIVPNQPEVAILQRHQIESLGYGDKLKLTMRILGDAPSYRSLNAMVKNKCKVEDKF